MISNPVPDPKISHSSAGSDSKNPDPEQHWRAAQKGGPAGCTTGWASELHIKLGCGKGRAGGLPFSAARPAFFRSPTNRLFCAARRPPLLSCVQQPASRSKIYFFHLETRPSSPPALQLVLSNNSVF